MMPLRKAPRCAAPLIAAAATATTLAAAAPAAQAGTLSQNLTCTGQAVSSPFAKWGDFAAYWLAPGGDFETGAAGWKLNKAKVVAGNETMGVLRGSKSLQLAGLGVPEATTPEFCVDPAHPTFRFVQKTTARTALLKTYINFRSSTGATLTVSAQLNSIGLGVLGNAVGAWQLSTIQPLATTIPSVFLGTGTTASITFKLAASSVGGTVNIDNVMIDPYRRG